MDPGHRDPSAPPLPANPSQYGQPIYHEQRHNNTYDPTHPPPPPPRFQYQPPRFYIPREDPVQKKQRRCLYMYYVLRQAAIILTVILIILNINIYVSRRGRYLNDDTSATDIVYLPMWLTVPLVRSRLFPTPDHISHPSQAGLMTIWGIVGLLCIRRSSHKGGMPYQLQFGVELLFALGALVCFVLLVTNIFAKRASGVDYYPYFRYEVPLAALLLALV
jgi:hypothetical protein